MRYRTFQIYGVGVELHPFDDTTFRVVIAGQEVWLVNRLREKKQWQCVCGRCAVREAEALLMHVVTNHANVTYREPWRAAKPDTAQDARSLEERLTYLRMVGLHADPTATQAIRLTMEPA
jgi:hypothetical protein